MYLKSIEIHGFKSFANRINFQFHNGITAIVGPNGSGKSNVADAVRWVLGEQRVKQLRGASMQDVIFSGTEARKPMGYAYVAITLDNSDHQLAVDYDEVTVARRLYRSGESEYLLNGTACRLKDVNELFYDTGIGKEGYSIIGQGQIERILSERPEDRRELFDEAAGIVKFKRRKETAEKKLSSEQENLVRVRDIIQELDKQRGPLEKQSLKAQDYLRLREELKRLEANMFLIENKDLTARLNETAGRSETAQRDLGEAKEEFERIRAEYDLRTAELEELEKGITEARDEIARTNVVRGQLEGDVKVYREQIKAGESSMAHFRTRLGAISTELDARKKERDDALTRCRAIEARMNTLSAERAGVAFELDTTKESREGLEQKIDESQSAIIKTLEERGAIRSRIAGIAASREQLEIRRAELTSKLVRVRTDESRQDELIAGFEADFERVTGEIARAKEERASADKELAGMKDILAENDRILQREKIAYHQDRTKLEQLLNLTERYDGFGQSVKQVMEHRSEEKGLIGVVADLLKTDAGYETAIETALGGSIQNIVTEDEATAKRMISMLKREKAGRATFLPLDSIEKGQKFRDEAALREPGAIGLASTLVRIDPRYSAVAESLLGRILVVDSFDHASAIGRRYRHAFRIVTVDGEMFIPGGAVSGGAFKNSSNLLGRRREIAELQEKVKQHREAEEKAEEAIENTKRRRNELRALIATSDTRMQALLIEQNTARLNVIREKEKKQETEGSYEEMRAEAVSIKDRTEELVAEKNAAEMQLAASERTEKETTEAIEKLQAEVEVFTGKEAELGDKVAEYDIELGRVREALSFEQQNRDRAEEELSRVESERREIEESITAGTGEIAEKKSAIEKIEQTILASADVLSDAEKRLKSSTERKNELSAEQKGFFDRREALSDQISGLDKECFRLNAQRERLQENLDSRIAYMWDEYQLTLSDAYGLQDETLTEPNPMKRRIGTLKQEIRDLGPVNVNAIDEYAALMQRYTFMKGQYDDLIEAAESLKGIISELDTNMRKQFREQFARINREFNEVFRELFGGGTGSLELIEDQDILEAGIRVIAQPPGKKLQNMMQMSGGEKSLTAIALLFAIQNLKPSPFCLLDEIEAALDESNVVRFAMYLHKLTKYTQFIVITHRRGTMEQADRLYGITMQEKGISALVSVSLIDKDLDN